MRLKTPRNIRRVGFVATRVAGTDGVSLETKKWADVLEGLGLECYFLTGESDQSTERTFIIKEAHFTHKAVKEIYRQAFGQEQRRPELTHQILDLTRLLREKLDAAINSLGIELLIAENSLTIPMNIPLGMAIVRTIQETGIPCIAHHHDFYWERERFLINAVDEFLREAFPPALSQIEHVVLNSVAAEEFSRRLGIPCRVVPNVMNFAEPPDPLDEYALKFREAVGLSEGDFLILQPTRVVARKGIERSIELIRLLNDPRAKLVITHSTGDEGDSYARHIRRYAKLLDVEVIFAERWISNQRGRAVDGRNQFTIWDVFQQADLVAYPSTYEGFGNAFLEAIYYKRPIVCNRYAIYRTDIEPCGFRTILLDGYLTDDVVEEARRALYDEKYREEMVEHNYQLGVQLFSYELLERELRSILS